MVDLDGFLHYRIVDVSSIKELSRRWFPRAYFAAPTKRGNHRALGVPVDPDRTTYYLGRTTIVPPEQCKKKPFPTRLRIHLFAVMKRNDRSATLYFRIPPNRVVELGTRFEL